MIPFLLQSLVLISWIYWLVAAVAVYLFFRDGAFGKRHMKGRPAESINGNGDEQPEEPPLVSMLKPVKGVDAEAYCNFVTFCQQRYPRYELLFGVASASDPAVGLIKRLQRQFPNHAIRLFVAPALGMNPKTGILHHLAREARGEILVLSDSDIRVRSDYLDRVIAPLADRRIGLVTCPYRGESAGSFWARLEAMHMDVTFLPSAVVAGTLIGACLGLGATMALRRGDLERIGGFEGFADHLADDYELAFRIAGLGLGVQLSDYMVSIVLGRTTLAQQWRREVRWARGIRVSCPLKFPGLIFTFSTPAAILLCLFSAFAPYAGVALGISLFWRWIVAWWILGVIGRPAARWNLPWLPLRDCLSGLVWCAGFFGQHVSWRDQGFTLLPDGRLQSDPEPIPAGLGRGAAAGNGAVNGKAHAARAESNAAAVPPGAFGKAVHWTDRILRRRQHIFEFTQDRRCLLRIALRRAVEPVELSDNTVIRPGDCIGELHLWNEHIPRIPAGGPSLSWGAGLRGQMRRSLRLLAEKVQSDPDLAQVKAFGGIATFAPRRGVRQMTQMAGRLGFEKIDSTVRRTLFRRLHDFGEDLLIWALIRTFNPGGLRQARLSRPRHAYWISSRRLLDLYGSEAMSKRRGREVSPRRPEAWKADPSAGAVRSSSFGRS